MESFLKHISIEFRKHLFDYLLLLSMSIFFILLLSLFKGNASAQFFILTAYISIYFAWSVFHHFQTQSLRYKIMLEYILIAGTLLFIIRMLTTR